jgi:hypothetical protein
MNNKLFRLGDFGFSLWSSWSACTTTCGDGLHWRARECEMPDPGSNFCTSENNQTDVCNLRSCPSMSNVSV